MRILAIRGENLASLQRFAVDLTAEPLAGAGLFAITGPTGAGKSTLLDALCLALYDTTPRLDERGGATIGRDDDEHKLAAYDVRNILRRGAAEGFAEVDFVGRDQRRYRAKWSVHRARKKADGKFQAQTIKFDRIGLDGEIEAPLTTDRKTDTLTLIAEKVGLQFDQFRRSVLLAQGEFDRFLKAEPRQRGELLEAMTGADLYRRLGQGAHRRAREQGETLARLRHQVEDIDVLADADRARIERRVVHAAQWVASAEHRRVDLDAASRWFERRAALLAAEEEATLALDQAETALDEQAVLSERLDAVEAAEPHRDTLRATDTASAEARAAMALADQRARALAELEVAWIRAQATEAQAGEARAAAQARATAAAPSIAEARRLDAAVEEAGRAVKRAEDEAATLESRAHDAAVRLANEDAARGEHRRTIADAEQWLAAHAAVAPVHAQWDRWSRRLEALAAARAAVANAARLEGAAVAAIGAADAGVEAATAALATAEEALRAARAAADSGAMQRAKAAVADAEQRVRALGAKEHALKNLLDRAREADRLGQQLTDGESERGEAKKQARSEKARAKRLAQKVADAAAALTAREAGLALMQAGLSLVEHRAALVDGLPCPLCGAVEHPGVAAIESEAIVLAEREAVEALRAELAADHTALALATERARVAEVEAERADADITAARDALARIDADWEMARMAYGADMPVAPLGAVQPITAAIEANHTAREQADAALAAAREEVAALDVRRELIEERRAAVDAARRALPAAWSAQYAAKAEAERAAERTATLAEAAAAIHAELDGVLAAWPTWAAGIDDPIKLEIFAETVAGQVEDYGHRAGRLRAATTALAEAERALGALIAEAEQRREAAAAGREAVERARTERDAVIAVRAALFEGRPVEAVEAALQRAVQRAEAEASARRDERAAVEARRETTADLLADAERARDRARRVAEQQQALLTEALEALEIDERSLRDRLSEGPEWVSRTREKLAEIDRRLGIAQALHRDRGRAREQHERTGRPAIEPAALDAARADVAAAVEAFREVLEADRGALRHDDRCREKRAGLAPGLSAEEQSFRLLADLSDLIGSHDGGRFRDFAQSLTLDAVVGLANRHLEELAPRYALMRVPSEDLELQVVDRDMGNEIRSVQSLSGGESFLVSLALALGLASLSARDTRLESLFIDEGFGSLDDKTLDQALSTLDALQASGRQVGLISHVPNFSERIGVQVAVVPEGPGRSRVEVRGVAG